MQRLSISGFALQFFASSCATVSPPNPLELAERRADAAAEVADMLSGSFSSANHAQSDERYFDIRMAIVPIWVERSDGPWLYVEQASAINLENPYRQRVYRIVGETADRVRSEIFEINADLRLVAGAQADEAPLDDLTPADLTLKQGCAVTLVRTNDDLWTGGTNGRGCSTTRNGATYATSEVTVGPLLVTSWDRGFGATGEFIWGAEHGPYRFDREQ